MAAGIAFVHQELNLFENLDVAANIFIGREPLQRRTAAPDRPRPAARAWSSRCSRRLNVDFRPETPVAELSIAQRQMVEIAKALSLNARLIIMDEPTSSLTLSETDRLLAGRGRAQGARGRASSTSPTAWARSRTAPTAWSACATAASSATLAQGRDRPRHHDPADDRPRPALALHPARRRHAVQRCEIDDLRTSAFPNHTVSLGRARRRDPGPGRPGRLRPHLAGARPLRHRPRAGRRGPPRRRAASASPRRATPSPAASIWCRRTASARA